MVMWSFSLLNAYLKKLTCTTLHHTVGLSPTHGLVPHIANNWWVLADIPNLIPYNPYLIPINTIVLFAPPLIHGWLLFVHYMKYIVLVFRQPITYKDADWRNIFGQKTLSYPTSQTTGLNVSPQYLQSGNAHPKLWVLFGPSSAGCCCWTVDDNHHAITNGKSWKRRRSASSKIVRRRQCPRCQ